MDLAAYRTVTSVGGALSRDYTEEGGDRYIVVTSSSPIDALVRVTVNSVPSLYVEMLGRTSFRVRIPALVAKVPLNRIVIRAWAETALPAPGSSEGALVPSTLGFGLRPTYVSGEAQALQTVLRALRMSPGSDPDHPWKGGGLVDIVPTSIALDDVGPITQRVEVAVSRVRSNLGKLFTPADSTKVPTHRVVGVDVQGVRLLTREDAESRLGVLRGSALSNSLIVEATDGTERVIAVSILLRVQGPQGVSQVSSAVVS